MRADYYQLLDVEPTASAKDIKASYYRLALRYHPDRTEGDPAAEERFKLVAEAYRTLGVPERRKEYDNWLHLHDLYRAAPELAGMSSQPHTPITPFHFSSIRARERQDRRMGRGTPRRRSRYHGILPRKASKVNTYLFMGFCALLVINILPMILRPMFGDGRPKHKPAAAVEEKEATPAEARTRLLAMEQELRGRATAGEAEAQYKLGLYLFNKSARGRGAGDKPGLLRRAASEGFRLEATDWFERAAAQGHGGAQRVLDGVKAKGAGQIKPASSAP